jgi:hypothetical protein
LAVLEHHHSYTVSVVQVRRHFYMVSAVLERHRSP